MTGPGLDTGAPAMPPVDQMSHTRTAPCPSVVASRPPPALNVAAGLTVPTASGTEGWWKPAAFHSRMVPLPFPVARAPVPGLKASALDPG